MSEYSMKIYLDNLRAGHAYAELLKPGEESGQTYGFYPAKFEEKKEVLFGEGSIRKDCDRLQNSGEDADIQLTGKAIALREQEYERAMAFVEKQSQKPNLYFILGYNCIDFIQEVYEAAKGEKSPSFLQLFDYDELGALSWVGIYAGIEKAME